MPTRPIGPGGLSRAEQFLLDDAKHQKTFENYMARQEKNIALLKMLNTSNQQALPEFDSAMEEHHRLTLMYQQIMAENARLLREEAAILRPGIFGGFGRLFRVRDQAELRAEAQIRQNAHARDAKNRGAR